MKYFSNCQRVILLFRDTYVLELTEDNCLVHRQDLLPWVLRDNLYDDAEKQLYTWAVNRFGSEDVFNMRTCYDDYWLSSGRPCSFIEVPTGFKNHDNKDWVQQLDPNGHEVMCSKILDKFNINHCYYRKSGFGISEHPVRKTEDTGMLSYADFQIYCETHNITGSFRTRYMDGYTHRKAVIADYLLCNPERNITQLDFEYDIDELEILGTASLTQFRNAFTNMDRDATYALTGTSLREEALDAAKRTTVTMQVPVVESDFENPDQFEEFCYRVKELNIKLKRNNTWRQFINKYNLCGTKELEAYEKLHDKYALADSNDFYMKLASDMSKEDFTWN